MFHTYRLNLPVHRLALQARFSRSGQMRIAIGERDDAISESSVGKAERSSICVKVDHFCMKG